MRKLRVSLELRTDGSNLNEDMERFRESGNYQKMVDWLNKKEDEEMIESYLRLKEIK